MRKSLNEPVKPQLIKTNKPLTCLESLNDTAGFFLCLRFFFGLKKEMRLGGSGGVRNAPGIEPVLEAMSTKKQHDLYLDTNAEKLIVVPEKIGKNENSLNS